MNVISETHNVLLHRRELHVVYPSASNPGYAAVQKALAEKLGASEDTIVVKHLTNPYGSSEFVIDVFVYDSVAMKQKFELRKKNTKAGDAS